MGYLYGHIIVSNYDYPEDEYLKDLLIKEWRIHSISSAGSRDEVSWMIILKKSFEFHEIEMGIEEIEESFRKRKREVEEDRK